MLGAETESSFETFGLGTVGVKERVFKEPDWRIRAPEGNEIHRLHIVQTF